MTTTTTNTTAELRAARDSLLRLARHGSLAAVLALDRLAPKYDEAMGRSPRGCGGMNDDGRPYTTYGDVQAFLRGLPA